MGKKVFCSDCGFFGLSERLTAAGGRGQDNIELHRQQRDEFQSGEQGILFMDRVNNRVGWVYCHRLLWVPWMGSVDEEDLREQRDCPYFFQYKPGDTPEKHKHSQELKETRRAMRNATLIGAAIGAVIGGLIATLVPIVMHLP